jgi:hypothetical protein
MVTTSIYQTLFNEVSSGNTASSSFTTPQQQPVSSVSLVYSTPNNQDQNLITLNKKQTVNVGDDIYEVTQNFNFPLFVENLQKQYGRINYVTQEFVAQSYIPSTGGIINGNLFVNGEFKTNTLVSDDLYSDTWRINLGRFGAPLAFIRSDINVLELPYEEGGYFYFKDLSNPTSNYITINPFFKRIEIVYNANTVANSDQWTSTYTTVQNNSGSWATGIGPLSGNWQSVYTTVQTNSSYWIQSNPNLETPTTGLSTVNNFIVLTQSTYDSLSIKNPSTLYFIVSG